MQRDWYLYHLTSNYKNPLEFPFNFDGMDFSATHFKGIA